MKLISEEINEIAKAKYGTDAPNGKQVAIIQKKFDSQMNFNTETLGIADDIAREKVIESMLTVTTKKKGSKKENKKIIKKMLLKLWEQGRKSTSAYEVTSMAVDEELYHTDSPKGIGDIMGRGRNGFFLEEVEKVDNKKMYKIPNPELFNDWYESDTPLPKEYYSDSYWQQLIDEEATSLYSTFFEDRV